MDPYDLYQLYTNTIFISYIQSYISIVYNNYYQFYCI